MEYLSVNEVLQKNRIIFITGEITQELANSVIAQMLYFEALDPKKDITIYLNTHGGDTEAMNAIIDIYSFVSPDISVVNLSCAYSAGSLLLACGTKGKRYMLPSAKVMIHQPSLFSTKSNWTCKELEEIVNQVVMMRKNYANTMKEHTSITQEQIDEFMQKDTFLNANECIELNIVDHILNVHDSNEMDTEEQR